MVPIKVEVGQARGLLVLSALKLKLVNCRFPDVLGSDQRIAECLDLRDVNERIDRSVTVQCKCETHRLLAMIG
jgi:hypothetical protein